MSRDGNARKEVVRFWVKFFHDGGGVEAVNEKGSATGAVGVRKKVEKLEAAWVRLDDFR